MPKAGVRAYGGLRGRGVERVLSCLGRGLQLVVAAGLMSRADCVAVDRASLDDVCRARRALAGAPGVGRARQIRRNTRSILVLRLMGEGLGDTGDDGFRGDVELTRRDPDDPVAGGREALVAETVLLEGAAA
jgi:hypothetical protein